MFGFEDRDPDKFEAFENLPPEFCERDFLLAGRSVYGNIAAFRGRAIIYAWWSPYGGEGNSIKALQEIRKHYNYIEVFDACNESYWNLMLDRGLIEEMN